MQQQIQQDTNLRAGWVVILTHALGPYEARPTGQLATVIDKIELIARQIKQYRMLSFESGT